MISLTCGHCYCQECQFKEPVLKILCRQCKERKGLVAENQLRLVVGCYRKLMQTLALSAKWRDRDCVADPKDPNFSPIPEIIREVTEGVKVSRAVLIVRPPERFLNVRQVPTPKKEAVVAGKKTKRGEKRKPSPKNPLKERQTNAQKKMKMASQIVKRRLQYTSGIKPPATSTKGSSVAQKKKQTQRLIEQLLGDESMTEEEAGWTSTTESQGTISDDDLATKTGDSQSLELFSGHALPLEVVSDCLSDPPTGTYAHFEMLDTRPTPKSVKKLCTKSSSLRSSSRTKRVKHPARTPLAPRCRWHSIHPGTHRHPRSRKKPMTSVSPTVLQLKSLGSPSGNKSSLACDTVVIATTPKSKKEKAKPEIGKRSHKKMLVGGSGSVGKKLADKEGKKEARVFQIPMQGISLPLPARISPPSHLITNSLLVAEEQSLLPLVPSETPPGLGSASSSAVLPFDLNEILAQAAATPPPKKKKKKKQKNVPTSFDCKLTLEEIEELRRKPRFRCRCGTNPGVMFLDMICCKHKCPCFFHELPCLRCKCRGCNNPFNKTMVTKETATSSS